jgi:hypothetical protein
MSWLFSRALVAEYSAVICLDGEQSAPSKLTHTPQAYLSRDKTTDAWHRFPSGMTCKPLMGDRGEELLTSYQAAFRAKTSVPQGGALESTASGLDSGENLPESLARYDRATCSWRTRQCLLAGDLVEFSETWPRWGSMRNGVSYRRDMSAHLISESVCGLLHPTPTRDDHKGATTKAMRKKGESYLKYWLHARFSRGASTTYPHPQLCELVNGWPIGWTELKPLEMDKFRQWQRLHGKS